MADFDFSGGGQGQGDILGLALRLMSQKQQDAREDAYRQQVGERQRQKMQTDALRDSLKALKDSGGNKKLAEAVLEAQTGGDFPDHYRTLIGESAKQFKVQAERPRGTEQTDMARGVAGVLQSGEQQGADPLRTAIAALSSYRDTGIPALNTGIAMRGGGIAADRAAIEQNLQARSERRSALTEASLERRAGAREARKTNAPTTAVEAAWETFLSAGVPFEEWRAQAKLEGVPASVIGDAMKHPAYREMLRSRRPPPGWHPPLALPGSEGPVDLGGGVKVLRIREKR